MPSLRAPFFVLALMAALCLAACRPSSSFDRSVEEQPATVETAAPSDPAAKTSGMVHGEAHLFRATKAVKTAHPLERVVRIFSYDAQGRQHDYRRGKDWDVDGGLIRRLPGSAIPDFAAYRYSTKRDCDEGRATRSCAVAIACYVGLWSCPSFKFFADPRNPPLTIGYNVYVDYMAQLPRTIIRARGEGFERAGTVLCTGDSIAAGAHTIASYYRDEADDDSWCGLLRRNLPDISFDNQARGGVSVGTVLEQVTRSPAKPEVVIIAFGMNDHNAGPKGLQTFAITLADTVARLKTRGLRVMLVGFFQQNPLWLGENPVDTRSYNEAIRTVARRQAVPFIDVRPAFDRLSRDAPPGQQFTADFMHHPNLYGQRIYFSLILPYFLRSDRPASEISDYIVGAE
jgi:lysophospholipase L1-like esterase